VSYRRGRLILASIVVLGMWIAAFLITRDPYATGSLTLSERLWGNEIAPRPLTTPAIGSFDATLSGGDDSLTFVLRYTELQGVAAEAHIHLGEMGRTGRIAAYLCSNDAARPADTPPCPAAPGQVTGTLDAGDVVGPEGERISRSEFERLARAIRAGVAYVDVHTDRYPGGELRGQLDSHRRG
jgi:hypothetical protein